MRSFESLPKDEQIDTLIVLMNYLAETNCVSLDHVAAVERRTAQDVWVSILRKLNLPETAIRCASWQASRRTPAAAGPSCGRI